MTELSTEPLVTDNQPAPTTPSQADPAPAPAEVSVEHTAGGWPVVPIAMTGANSTVTALATAALAGGPIAAAVAATGACVLGVAAATRNHRARKHATGRTNRGANPHSARRTNHGTGGVHGASSRGTSGRSAKHAGRSTSRTGSTSSVPHQRKNTNNQARKAAGHTPGKPARQHSPGRAGQVKALRASARQTAPSRAARRVETTGSRRAVADARRSAKTAARSASTARKGPIGRSVSKAAGRVSAAKGAVVDRNRKARDQRTVEKVAAQRGDVRKAPARKKARKALWRSAARFQGRRLRAALLGGALGLVGMLTTPLGRKLGWAWLMYPGRRLYARLTRTAEEQRHLRDDAIRAALKDDEAAADTEADDNSADQVGATAERPAGPTPAAPTTSSSEGESVSGFRFEEYAAEMESAAGQYDPENAMEILAMVEGLPAALTSVANVMKVLAERADSEFPLEKDVADGFNDIFGAVMSAVAVAEDMGPLFRQSHEQDIARHEDPRNGPEAEKGWNV
ncbi:hypothetical protein OIE61_13945 [Streptomyces sp. NBC_01762]|uniref:hypothetical protein n=1 Tax=unclassified Streptomyces TaxID=2593676 RepID=UPI002DD8C864|nr:MULTISPECIES: hypothetical protein [unclassified Streptomyces]WSC44969.1 hypothetical protein OIE61_13945 [Streptomyces sp. NBC_01762]WSD24629.1 hypothetical protein OHA26_14680 [Streptomyces sp. NBC_01751]